MYSVGLTPLSDIPSWIVLIAAVAFVLAFCAIDEYRRSRERKARNTAAKAREDAEWWDEKQRLRYMGLLSNEGRE
ncbi:hypothetical protein ACFRMQ_00215 [Kitasatospora sp. NPDC056783]|uniref:hypothetical protein n=1 Tax=Kitasatospora sp. NPDC056783 TaxID=3345943 RepID=UPI00367C4299